MRGLLFLDCLWTVPPSPFHRIDSEHICDSRGDLRSPVQPPHLKEAQRNYVTCSGSRGWLVAGWNGNLFRVQYFFTRRCCWACNEIPTCLHCLFPHLLFFFLYKVVNHFRNLIKVSKSESTLYLSILEWRLINFNTVLYTHLYFVWCIYFIYYFMKMELCTHTFLFWLLIFTWEIFPC